MGNFSPLLDCHKLRVFGNSILLSCLIPKNSLSVGELFGNIFLNNAILGLADFFGMTILTLVLRFFKRPILQSLCFILLGTTLFASSILRAFFFEETKIADLVLMLTAKLFSAGEFNVLFLKNRALYLSCYCNDVFDHTRVVPHNLSLNCK